METAPEPIDRAGDAARDLAMHLAQLAKSLPEHRDRIRNLVQAANQIADSLTEIRRDTSGL